MVLKVIKYTNKSNLQKALNKISEFDILIIPFNKSNCLNLDDDCKACPFVNSITEKYREQNSLVFLCLKINIGDMIVPTVFIIFKGEIIKIIKIDEPGYVRIDNEFFNIAVVSGLNIYNKYIAASVMKTQPNFVLGFDDGRAYVQNKIIKNRYNNRLLLCGSNRCFNSCHKYTKTGDNIYQYIVQKN